MSKKIQKVSEWSQDRLRMFVEGLNLDPKERDALIEVINQRDFKGSDACRWADSRQELMADLPVSPDTAEVIEARLGMVLQSQKPLTVVSFGQKKVSPMNLLLFQEPDGSWEFSQKLAHGLGVGLKELDQLGPSLGPKERAAMATHLVLQTIDYELSKVKSAFKVI